MTKKSRKKGRAVSTEDLPFWQKRQKLAIIIKKVKKRWRPVSSVKKLKKHTLFNLQKILVGLDIERTGFCVKCE